jgi:hypothetical protein
LANNYIYIYIYIYRVALEGSIKDCTLVSKWDLLFPGVREVHLKYNNYTVKEVSGDGNCLTNCVQEVLLKFRKKSYSIEDLKLWLALYILKSLSEQSSICSTPEDSHTAEVSLQIFLSAYGTERVSQNWKHTLGSLDGPDGSGNDSSFKKAIDDIDIICQQRKLTPTLQDLYDRVLNLILKDGYYLPSEALIYYCEAFSLNISLWYPQIDSPGSYIKQEEYGYEYEHAFMFRQIQFGLKVNKKSPRKNSTAIQLSWSQKKKKMSEGQVTHFDVLYLERDGVFELYTREDREDSPLELLGNVKLADDFRLVKNTQQGKIYCFLMFYLAYFIVLFFIHSSSSSSAHDENSSSSSSSSQAPKRLKQGGSSASKHLNGEIFSF